MKNTSTRKDKITGSKPDCGLFLKSSDDEQLSARSYMAEVQIPIEMKPQKSQDAFNNITDTREQVQKEKQDAMLEISLTKNTDQSILHRGQQIDYVTQIMSLQHRTHVFSLSIMGHHARIIRWDRAGAIVSKSFDYVSSKHLIDFLSRYEHATPERRGYDRTVIPALPEEIAAFTSAVNSYAEEFSAATGKQLDIDATMNADFPACKISVGGGPSPQTYIVRSPFFNATSPCGRATRGYLALDCSSEEPELVFLKDTWRVNVAGVPSETDIYNTLKEKEVPHLPTVIASGDVVDSDGSVQRTVTHQYAGDMHDWYHPTAWICEHFHHRVVQEIALPLAMVQESKQLIRAIRNTLIGMFRLILFFSCRTHVD